MFGTFIRDLRLKKELGLREFCIKAEVDPSYWSKVEREVIAPPQSKEKLREIAKILSISKGSKDWNELKERAALGAGKLPEDLLSDKELVECLPLVFRTLRFNKPTKSDLKSLADKIRHIRKS
jgi:transcriptional regulator with XRE-family HTH domain